MAPVVDSFTVNVIDDIVKLHWRTETEVNNYGFEIERKSNIESDWKLITFVEGYGNSNSPKQDSYIDSNPIGGSKFHYRLKQIDNDGQFEYSNVVEIELRPEQYALYQNYPNPFNPVTKIRYSVPHLSNVVINIIDILGNEIETIVNEEKPAGKYEFEFDGNKLSSGIYFYRLQASNYIETKKMVLIK